MADPVIITTGDGGSAPDPGATFAAGVAAATAVQAAEQAQEAGVVAENAESAASAALSAASDAEYSAAQARDEIRALEERFMVAVSVLAEAMAEASEPPPDTGAPEVIVSAGDVEVTEGDGKDKSPREGSARSKRKSERGFGWDGWFGKR